MLTLKNELNQSCGGHKVITKNHTDVYQRRKIEENQQNTIYKNYEHRKF